MLEAYITEYGNDPYLEILAVEQPFELELVHNDEVIAIFIGIFDGVAIDHWDNLMVLLEHKTAGAIKTMHLPLDNQAGSYFSAATIVLRHQGIIGPAMPSTGSGTTSSASRSQISVRVMRKAHTSTRTVA